MFRSIVPAITIVAGLRCVVPAQVQPTLDCFKKEHTL